MTDTVAFIDPIGGAAGDMLLAALIDAGADLKAVEAAVEAVLPGGPSLAVEPVQSRGIRALQLQVTPKPDEPTRPMWSTIDDRLAAVRDARIEPRVRDRAQTILLRLWAAESRIHGVGISELSLHQLGEDDTIVDVVGVAAALEALEVDRLLVPALPMPVGGTVTGPHGALPLPAPATLELLRGFVISNDGSGELVTPTAAAIFAALGTASKTLPAMEVRTVGYGAGTRTTKEPNLVRVIVGQLVTEPNDGGAQERDLSLLETNLDDLSPQLVADAVESIRAAGALDAWVAPVQMKKGRPGVVLSALSDAGHERAVRDTMFQETATLGIRVHRIRRTELARRFVDVDVPGGSVRVKLGLLNGMIVSATPEHDEVAALAGRTGQSVRAVHAAAVAAWQQHAADR
jgi:pyridinium-3,5-bisthiocarboxylic acid mononucleotide nickel chelatase